MRCEFLFLLISFNNMIRLHLPLPSDTLFLVKCRSSSGSTTLLGCLVCVIFNSNTFHSFILKLCIMIIHTLKMCTFYFVYIWWNFITFLGVLNLDIMITATPPMGCLHCVICNSNGFLSFLFKPCILIHVHLLFCTFLIILIFLGCWTRHFYMPTTCATWTFFYVRKSYGVPALCNL